MTLDECGTERDGSPSRRQSGRVAGVGDGRCGEEGLARVNSVELQLARVNPAELQLVDGTG